MRLRAAIPVFLLCSALFANAGVLKGVVKENELGGSTVANVAISAPGANPTKTDQYGEFMLNFPSKKAGETVLLSVSKTGYVVVNDIQLEQVLPAEPRANPLVILICRQSRREEMARRFYRLVSDGAIEANYQKRLKELQAASGEQIAFLHFAQGRLSRLRRGLSRPFARGRWQRDDPFAIDTCGSERVSLAGQIIIASAALRLQDSP